MATSKQKALWSSSNFQSRTTAERKAYRAALKAGREAFYRSPQQIEAQREINEAHAAWLAAGMPDR